MSKKGYEELTESESELFNSEKIGERATFCNQRKSIMLPAILCSIATVILIIVSIAAPSVQAANAKDKALHSPDQITVSIISKTQEYKESDSFYSDGKYYIVLFYKCEKPFQFIRQKCGKHKRYAQPQRIAKKQQHTFYDCSRH
ncbi:MAG: hypothetical protein PUI31_05645 [Clostridia bacterium]|nr:hypothetical protein [Clostridia bacterium]MDY5531936.1 hypothetical protein [Pumilibacteraceae bacterium]